MNSKHVLIAISAFVVTISCKSETNPEIHISIHANIDAKTAAPSWLRVGRSVAQLTPMDSLSTYLAEAESVTAGHAWISVKNGNSCRTYGLFAGGPTVDAERKYHPGIVRTRQISINQLNALQDAIAERRDYRWTGYYNCANYAVELWQAATSESINPVPVKAFHSAVSDGRYSVNENIKIKPLPPSPLGIVQSIIKSSAGTRFTWSSESVCKD